MSAKKAGSRGKRAPSRKPKPKTKRTAPAPASPATALPSEVAPPKRGRGRPSDFRDEFCDQVEKLCKLGATDAEIAEFFDRPISTISNWKLKHPEFMESIKRGKIRADAEVADGLYRRATGYEWDEHQPIKVKEIVYSDAGKKIKEVERVDVVKVHKVVPPDTPAAIFWLCNRQKDKWRQRQEITGANGKPLGGDVNLDEVRDAINSKFDRIAATLAAAGVPQKP